MSADSREVEPGVFSVLSQGRSYEVRVDGNRVWVDGRPVTGSRDDPREWNRKKKSALGGGAESVLAPMPGKIIRVLVASGELVTAGQGIMVIEAMKMQNELKAARAGTITRIAVKPHDTVTAGTVLAVIE